MDPTHLKKSELTFFCPGTVLKKTVMLLNLEKLLYTLAIVEDLVIQLIKKENKKLLLTSLDYFLDRRVCSCQDGEIIIL